MDDYMFRSHLQKCKYVHEETRYLEIFNYSVRRFTHPILSCDLILAFFPAPLLRPMPSLVAGTAFAFDAASAAATTTYSDGYRTRRHQQDLYTLCNVVSRRPPYRF